MDTKSDLKALELVCSVEWISFIDMNASPGITKYDCRV